MILSGLFLGLAPLMASAATASCSDADLGGLGDGTVGFRSIICEIGKMFSTLIPIIITLGVVFFIWGVVQYVISADEEAKKKGRDKMIYGLIGLVIFVGLWGIIGLIQNTFGLSENDGVQTITTIPI